MKIKVGDKVKLRNGEEDLIVAEVKIKSLNGYEIGVSSRDLGSYFNEPFDDGDQPFVSKKGNTYEENGSYLSGGTPDECDIVEVIREKKKVKKYKWIFQDLFTSDLHVTDSFYSEEDLKNCPLPGNVLQKIDSTMKEMEVSV